MASHRIKRRYRLLLLGLLWPGVVSGFDGLALEAGNGDDSVKIVRLSTRISQWERPQKKENAGMDLQIFWELGLAYWSATEKNSGTGELLDVSATPVFRFSSSRALPRVFAEVAIGVHVLSDHRIGDRELSSTYHFGSIAGVGVELGEGRYEAGIRLQHLSNASVDLPNPGINFGLVHLGIRY